MYHQTNSCQQYHISNTKLIARFATVLANPDYYLPSEDNTPSSFSSSSSSSPDSNKNTLRIFSGDAFSPSLEAAVLRGDHMAPVLDSLGIDAACYGNHDFDFGETRLVELAKQETRFPWLLANAVSEKEGGDCRLLAGAREYLVKEVAGCRIGFFGLAGTYGHTFFFKTTGRIVFC